VLPLVDLRGPAARHRDVFRRRVDEVVRQTGRLVGHWIAVELGPAGVVVQHHMEHQIVRNRTLKPIVAEGAGELMRKRRVLVHHNRQSGLSGRRRLNDHAQALALPTTEVANGQ
jgi:hypothetical protein